jgi:hypothetical protein
MDRESIKIKQGGLAVAGFASAVKGAFLNKGPAKLQENPQMRVIGIKEPEGDEEHALKELAFEKAGRQVNLIALPYDENREELLDELGRSNISMMLSWHEGFGLTGWEAIAGEVPLILSRQTGVWQLLQETLGKQIVEGYVRALEVRGREGDDDTANFLPQDEEAVREAIIDCTSKMEASRQAAAKLKQELKKELICTWTHTAKQFCDGLGIEGSTRTTPIPVDPNTRTDIAPSQVVKSTFVSIPKSSWPEELTAKGFEMPDSMLLRPESRTVGFHRLRFAARINCWMGGRSDSIYKTAFDSRCGWGRKDAPDDRGVRHARKALRLARWFSRQVAVHRHRTSCASEGRKALSHCA